MQVRKVKAKCPSCKQKGFLVKQGFYMTHAKPRKRQRYTCLICSVSFSIRRSYYKKRFDVRTIQRIKKFALAKKSLPNKHDARKGEAVFLYSSREVVVLIKKNETRLLSERLRLPDTSNTFGRNTNEFR